MTIPTTRKELFERLSGIIQHGEYTMSPSCAGAGAPGLYLEELLELTTGNRDVPMLKMVDEALSATAQEGQHGKVE